MSTAKKPRPKRTQSRALPWFGSDAMVCEQYAALLADCKHVTVPFCGGLSVVAHLIETSGEVVCNDKHRFAMNFYKCISDPETRRRLLDKLDATPFHQQLLEESQAICKCLEKRSDELIGVEIAFHYFVTCWMGRSGKSGTKSEFNGGLAMRWDAGGGSSPLRCQTAVRSIKDFWGPICERCSFVYMDWSEILAKVKDDPKCGIYCDPPWVGAGDDYKHAFTEEDQSNLAYHLQCFQRTKVVLRHGDGPFIRELFGDERYWHIREITSRDQANGGVRELCITNF